MIKTEAGEKMKQENPVEEKKDLNQDGEYEAWEQARQEAIAMAQKFEPETPEMNMGGLMHGGMGVIIGIEKESGNEIPAGSKAEEVADDIPAMLSEGEYVVPADVVRWHGVKTFEQMRCEAKMGMGLMAEDGRIAEVEEDEEYEHGHESPEYEIEEEDKPEVEEAEYKVVEAADGVDVSSETSAPYYGYKVVFDPVARRYVFRPVDPTTQQAISPEAYDPSLSTRYTPENLLGISSEEEETPECPDGFYYDEEAGACMPEKPQVPASVVQPDGGDGDGMGPPDYVPYSQQLTTKIAEALGPLSPEDLAEYEGKSLSDKAISRMTDARPTSIAQAGLALATGPGGILGLGIKNAYDSVGAKRAAITRENYLTGKVSGLTDTPTAVGEGVKAYNWTFNPETASFNKTPATTEITATQRGEGGSSWATDYNNVGASGKSYSIDDIMKSEAAFEDVLDAIDAEYASMSTVTGGGTRGQVTDYGTSYSPAEVDPYDADEASDNADRGTSTTSSGPPGGSTASDDPSEEGSTGGWESSPSYGYDYAKGGYVTKKNRPKVATMQYSKGSK